MGTFSTSDRNGNAVSFNTFAYGSNIVGGVGICDQAVGLAANIAPNGIALQVSSDGITPTYRSGAIGQTLYSGAAAVLVEIVGSATKTVRIKKITVWGQAGTKFYTELTLLRCTGVSGGTPVVATIGKHDKNDGAATAVVNYYTAAAAAGAGATITGAGVLTVAPPAAGMAAFEKTWDFSRNQDKALILRGTGDVVEVFNNITGLGTATFGFEVEFEEVSTTATGG